MRLCGRARIRSAHSPNRFRVRRNEIMRRYSCTSARSAHTSRRETAISARWRSVISAAYRVRFPSSNFPVSSPVALLRTLFACCTEGADSPRRRARPCSRPSPMCCVRRSDRWPSVVCSTCNRDAETSALCNTGELPLCRRQSLQNISARMKSATCT